MYMQQGATMNPGRNVGMPMGNFPQGPGVLPGPLAFLEKTTSNIGKRLESCVSICLHFLFLFLGAK